VLSFPWAETPGPAASKRAQPARRPELVGIKDFLGDVVISVPAAERNAAMEGHSTVREMRWLILHGVLHLMGYDHESDDGEMMALELKLRDDLEGSQPQDSGKSKVKSQKSRVKMQNRGRLDF
jgi:probable rRNA maturation factor